jgi:HK97 family phage major capsid protein
MALQARIQDEYNKATEYYGQAKALLDEYGDKEMPQEKSNEVDQWFAAFDKHIANAKRLEGAAARERQVDGLNQPQNDLDAPKGMKGKPGEGREQGGDDNALYMKAWSRALRQGPNRLNADEAKSLRADVDPAGGYLTAPQQVVNELIKAIDDAVLIRGLATIYKLEKAESLGIPVMDSDLSDAEWTSELTVGAEDTVEPFNKRELKPNPLSKEIKISRKLLRHATINVENLVRDRLAYRFAVTEEKGFLTGSGANQPLGVFTASTNGVSTGRDVTAASATAVEGDDFIDLKFKLKPAYWPKARMILHRDVLKLVRKLKDNDNNYIWSPGLGPGGGLTGSLPPTIVDIPFLSSEFAPNTVSTGQYVAVIGDFSYYWIAEALSLEIQVLMELYSRTNQVGYIGRMEVDGMPVHEEAFARLRLA